MSSSHCTTSAARKSTGNANRRTGAPPTAKAQQKAKMLELGRKKMEKDEKKLFTKFFPKHGEGMVTGKGHVIGTDAPLLKFVPSFEHAGKDFDFIGVLDYIDPVDRDDPTCDDPSGDRHYLVQWQVDGVPETSWTHCTNFDDHLSGLQDFYPAVTKTRLAAAEKEFEEKLAKKDRRIARRTARIAVLTRERDEALAQLARAGSPKPNGDLDFAEGEFGNAAFASDVRTCSQLADAFDFDVAYEFGSQAPSRASSQASSASEQGRIRSLPDWIDTTGWCARRINATTRAFRKLRANNIYMSGEHFKAKVLEHVAQMDRAAQE